MVILKIIFTLFCLPIIILAISKLLEDKTKTHCQVCGTRLENWDWKGKTYCPNDYCSTNKPMERSVNTMAKKVIKKLPSNKKIDFKKMLAMKKMSKKGKMKK